MCTEARASGAAMVICVMAHGATRQQGGEAGEPAPEHWLRRHHRIDETGHQESIRGRRHVARSARGRAANAVLPETREEIETIAAARVAEMRRHPSAEPNDVLAVLGEVAQEP